MHRLVPKRVIKVEGEGFFLVNNDTAPSEGFTKPSWIKQANSGQEIKRDWIMKTCWLEAIIENFFNSTQPSEKREYALELRLHLIALCIPTLNLAEFSNKAIREISNDNSHPSIQKLSADERLILAAIISYTDPVNNDKTIPSILEPIITKRIKKQVAYEVLAINLCRILVGENSPKGKILLRHKNGKISFRVLSQRINSEDLFYTMAKCVDEIFKRKHLIDQFKSRTANPNGTQFEYFCSEIKRISKCHSGLFQSLLIRLIFGDRPGCIRIENMINSNGAVVNIDTGNFFNRHHKLATESLQVEHLLHHFSGGRLNPTEDENTNITFRNGFASFAFYFSKHSAANTEIHATLQKLREVLSSDLSFLFDKFRTLPDGSELLSAEDIAEVSSFLRDALQQVCQLLGEKVAENVVSIGCRK